jgi:hypothetical protein
MTGREQGAVLILMGSLLLRCVFVCVCMYTVYCSVCVTALSNSTVCMRVSATMLTHHVLACYNDVPYRTCHLCHPALSSPVANMSRIRLWSCYELRALRVHLRIAMNACASCAHVVVTLTVPATTSIFGLAYE